MRGNDPFSVCVTHLIFELQPCEAGSEAVIGLYLKSADGRLADGVQVASVSPGVTNRYEFYPVPSGRYFVDIDDSAGEYITETSLALGGFSGNLISIPDSGGSIISQAQIRCDGAKLAGKVESEDELDGQAFVLLQGRGRRSSG
jgi:hypothetical protein